MVNHWHFHDLGVSDSEIILSDQKTSCEIVALNKDMLLKLENDLGER